MPAPACRVTPRCGGPTASHAARDGGNGFAVTRPGPALTRAARLLAAAVLVLLAATACGPGGAQGAFTDAGGEVHHLRAERRPREEAAAARAAAVGAAALSPRHAVGSTARLMLRKPVPVYAGEAITVAARSDLDEFTVDLLSGGGTVSFSRTVTLGGSGTIHHQLVLDTSFELRGLQLHAPPAAADGRLELAGAAMTPPTGDLLVRDGELLAGSGFVARGGARFDGTALRPVDLDVAPSLFSTAAASAAGTASAGDGGRRPALPWLLALGLHNPGVPGGEVRIILEGAGGQRGFLVTRQPGRQLVYLHGGEIGFQPRRVRLDPAVAGSAAPAGGASAPGLLSAAVQPLPPGGRDETPVAVPADLGTILRLDRTHWRRDDFELYQWSGVPAATAPLLIFDTVDYATQSRLFRRLAFFVEKRGFRGRLLGDEDLAGRRGYNAHDYAAPDLARFFSLAQEQGVALNAAEHLLRDVAVSHGIVQPDPAGGWRAGAGAVLSISQASYAGLRDLLLRHEALHGLYFTHGAYRETVWAAWQQLSAAEQRFWTLLLASVNYDVEYPDLVVNEFQSYLLQQDAHRLAGFLARWNGRLRSRHPEHADSFAAVTGATGRWRELHRRLATALADTTGVHSDNLILVRAASRK